MATKNLRLSLKDVLFLTALVAVCLGWTADHGRQAARQSLMESKLVEAELFWQRWSALLSDFSTAQAFISLAAKEGECSSAVTDMANATILNGIEGVLGNQEDIREWGKYEESLELYRSFIDLLEIHTRDQVRQFIADQVRDELDEETFGWMFPHLSNRDSEEYRRFDQFLGDVFSHRDHVPEMDGRMLEVSQSVNSVHDRKLLTVWVQSRRARSRVP